MGRRRTARPTIHERELDWPDADALRHACAERALSRRGGRRKSHLVPGIFRTLLRLRPVLAPHHSAPRRRCLHHRRLKDLDLLCRPGQSLFSARAHRRPTPRRPLHLPCGYENTRHQRAPHPEPARRRRHPRSLFRQRGRARQRPAGRRRPSRQHHYLFIAERARRDRPLCLLPPCAGRIGRAAAGNRAMGRRTYPLPRGPGAGRLRIRSYPGLPDRQQHRPGVAAGRRGQPGARRRHRGRSRGGEFRPRISARFLHPRRSADTAAAARPCHCRRHRFRCR